MKAIGSSVFVRGGVDERNVGTRVVAVSRPPADFTALFVEAYSSFAPICRAVEQPGLAIVAVSEGTRQLVGLHQLAALPGAHAVAIVGRHDRCDLFLDANVDLPLRQLAVIIDPVHSWERGRVEVTYRILDLRTERGFVDERGRALRGVRCDGPAVLRCAGYALYVLPLGDPSDWPESGPDAWACQPERVYFDELERCPEGSIARRPLPRSHQQTSVVLRTPGPRDTGMQLVTRGDDAGTLVVSGPTRSASITVGHQALRDGVLLGRYERCDANELGDTSLSRVHALFLLVGDRLLLIDTASTNGTRVRGGQDARVIELAGDTELELGFETRARWRWTS